MNIDFGENCPNRVLGEEGKNCSGKRGDEDEVEPITEAKKLAMKGQEKMGGS